MPDPYRGYRSGDPIPRDAGAFNAFSQGARYARDQTKVQSAEPLGSTRRSGIVRIKNETGTDLPAFAIVGLGAPIFTPNDSPEAFAREVTFRGLTPVIGDHFGRFAVLLEPAPADRVVRAYVAGVCQVKIDVIDENHRWADVLDTDTGKLESTDFGSAQILWREGDEEYGYYDGYATGEQWAIVRLGQKPQGDWNGKVGASPIAAKAAGVMSSGTVRLFYTDTDGSEIDSERDIQTFNPSSDIMPAGAEIIFGNVGGFWEIKNRVNCS
jgi:hypothetical protein